MLLRNAEELQSYSRSEEDRMEELIKGIADSGAKVIVAGSSIGEMAMHFVEKYGLMAVRIPSKFDLRRFCRCDLVEIKLTCDDNTQVLCAELCMHQIIIHLVNAQTGRSLPRHPSTPYVGLDKL